MVETNDQEIAIGGSKRYSVADDVSIRAKREFDDWGIFDEDWGFRVYDIPDEFRTKKKFENFALARKEEDEKKLVLESHPYQIDLEPTNVCNLHCPLCSTGNGAETRDKGFMRLNNFKNLIDEIKDTVLQLSLQNWGESTLVKDFPKMIRYAADAGIFMRLSTNFSVEYDENYLSEFMNSGLGRLVIDIDGTTQEIYEQYRVGGNLDLVLNNIKKIVKFKKENNLQYPIIQARMLVMKQNEHQIEDFKKLAKELDVDEMELGNIQLNPNTAAEKWLPKDKQYVYDTYQGENRTTPCHWPWSGLTINWDGGISPCPIVDDPKADFGNVIEDGLMNVWNNEYYISARSEFSPDKQKTKFTICNMCKNDTHNPKLLRVGDSFSLTLDKKINFIE
jgi:MoaA/NifB/PqqE/SkfB family radical SAM enzyme